MNRIVDNLNIGDWKC